MASIFTQFDKATYRANKRYLPPNNGSGTGPSSRGVYGTVKVPHAVITGGQLPVSTYNTSILTPSTNQLSQLNSTAKGKCGS